MAHLEAADASGVQPLDRVSLQEVQVSSVSKAALYNTCICQAEKGYRPVPDSMGRLGCRDKFRPARPAWKSV